MSDPIACVACREPLNNGNGFRDSDLCPRCWSERIIESCNDYPNAAELDAENFHARYDE